MDRRWVLVGAVGLMSIAAGAWWGRGVSAPPPPSDTFMAAVTAPATTLGTIVVHVSGWVERPGVVSLPSGARVADAVAAVGSVRSGASLDAVNLAEILVDGHRVHVPGPGAEPAQMEGPSATSSGLIRVNSASPVELEALPGVGPVLAHRIVAYREANGPFGSVEELLEVPGIGEAKLAALRDLVAVP